MRPEPPTGPDLIGLIRSSVIGEDVVVDGPFGPRRVTYADYTAAGRSLSFIEEFIRELAALQRPHDLAGPEDAGGGATANA